MKIDQLFLGGTLFVFSSLYINAATTTVTNTNDSGSGSLRQAIAGAVSGDTINFSVTGTIVLTSGELSINKNLTIQGPGAGQLSISGDALSRVFYIPYIASVTATLDGITIKDGNDVDGAGIANGGTLTISNSIIFGNSALYAGAIRNGGIMTVDNCTFFGNTAEQADGAIGNNGTMTIRRSSMSGNTAGGGGAIWNGGFLTIISSTLSGNVANGGGGTYYDFNGGAIYNEGGKLTTINTTIVGNSGAHGAGIYSTYGEESVTRRFR